MAWLFDIPPTTIDVVATCPSIDGGGSSYQNLAIDLVADDERTGVGDRFAASRDRRSRAERIRRRVDDDQLRLRRDSKLRRRIDVDHDPAARDRTSPASRRDARERCVRDEAGIRDEHFIARIDVRLKDREERLLGPGRDADFVSDRIRCRAAISLRSESVPGIRRVVPRAVRRALDGELAQRLIRLEFGSPMPRLWRAAWRAR